MAETWTQGVTIKGPKGEDGAAADPANGTDGFNWFSEEGAPTTVATSAVGDYYLNETTGDIYKRTA